MKAEDFIYNWNQIEKDQIFSNIQIEDDTIRDGLQGTFLTRPNLKQKLELIQQTINIGIQQAMLGFPAASNVEFHEASKILSYLDDKQLPLDVYFLARAKESDVNPIIKLHQKSNRNVCADFFIGISQLRCLVEKWDFPMILHTCENVVNYLNKHKTPFSISLEDVSRADPESIEKIITLCLRKKAKRITLCDTVGAMTPKGTRNLINFVKQIFHDHQENDVILGWHGHNDNGLVMANAIAAIESGINFISGTFIGIGERAGNIPLEQIILFLYQQYNQLFCLKHVVQYCQKLSKIVNHPIPFNAPITGRQVFSTATGTHASAIVKAAKIGIDFEDLIFSSVPATKVGRRQEIYLNHNSGTANAAYVLDKLGIEKNSDNIKNVLKNSKNKNSLLTEEDILKQFLHGEIFEKNNS